MTLGSAARQRRRSQILLLAVLGAIAGGEWLLVNPGSGISGGTGISGSIGAADRLALVSANPSAGAYTGVITHDLFAQDRKAPPDVSARFGMHSGAGTDQMGVIGIVTSGTDRVAVITGVSGAGPIKVHVGDRVGAAKVTAITPDQVTLDRDGKTLTLSVVHSLADATPATRAETPYAVPNAAAAEKLIRDYYKGRQLGRIADPDKMGSVSNR